ncbi:MAG: hypothetical protein QOH50_1038 [Kribbellaceae bacterium]|jgi:hypothetical protein|nr:hypothetical protein [Kribbellaceae bacterium]
MNGDAPGNKGPMTGDESGPGGAGAAWGWGL